MLLAQRDGLDMGVGGVHPADPDFLHQAEAPCGDDDLLDDGQDGDVALLPHRGHGVDELADRNAFDDEPGPVQRFLDHRVAAACFTTDLHRPHHLPLRDREVLGVQFEHEFLPDLPFVRHRDQSGIMGVPRLGGGERQGPLLKC